MAMQWIEGFESYSTTGQDVTTALGRKYPLVLSSHTLVAGRTGGLALRIPGSSASRIGTPFFTSVNTWIVGFGYKPVNSGQVNIVAFHDSGDSQIELMRDATGLLFLNRNGNFITGSTGTNALLTGTWYYIEIKVVIHNSTGTAEVRINGVPEINLTGIDTQTSGNATANRVVFLSDGNLASDFDDIYVCDNTGSFNNDFLGDGRVEILVPSGAGTTTEWTPLSSTNVSNIDEIPPDDDTTYVSSGTPNQVDTYAFTNLSVIQSNVRGLQVNILHRKDDAGARDIAPVVRSGSTNFVGDTKSVLDTYSYMTQVYETDPNTSDLWTVSNVNAAEFGQKLIS